MKNFVKIWIAVKRLSIGEMVTLGMIFIAIFGWVYKVNAQIEKGCQRDAKFIIVESEIQDIKVSVAEIKISNEKIDKNVELLLVRGLNNARYNQ